MFESKADDVQIEMPNVINVEFTIKKVARDGASCIINDYSFISMTFQKLAKCYCNLSTLQPADYKTLYFGFYIFYILGFSSYMFYIFKP